MKVRIIWGKRKGGGSDIASQENKNGFEAIPNIEVEMIGEVNQEIYMSGADLILTNNYMLMATGFVPQIPTIAQIGGVGPSQPKKPLYGMKNVPDNCFLMPILDTNIMHLYWDDPPENWLNAPVVPNGINHEMFRPERVEDDKIRVLYTSTESAYELKRPDRFVDAAEILHKDHPDVEFIFPCKRMNFPYKWLKHDWLKLVPSWWYQEMPEIYRTIDICCTVSLIEVFPNTATEAFACGKPLVCDSIAGSHSLHSRDVDQFVEMIGSSAQDIDDVFHDKYWEGDGYHYTRAQTVPEIVDALDILISSDNCRRQMGGYGQRWANKWISWEQKAQKLLDLCKEKDPIFEFLLEMPEPDPIPEVELEDEKLVKERLRNLGYID